MDIILNKVFETIIDRKNNPAEGSYTAYLFREGQDKILKKCGEECAETIIAAKNHDKEELVCEVSDLLFHLLVLLANEGLGPDEITQELARRHQITGNLKEMHQTDKNS